MPDVAILAASLSAPDLGIGTPTLPSWGLGLLGAALVGAGCFAYPARRRTGL